MILNNALKIKNWNDGGNSYILKSDSSNRWTGFQASVIERLRKKYNLEFNIIIYSVKTIDDYYCIPFKELDHLFTEENKTSGKYANRWTATLVDHTLRLKGNNNLSLNIKKYHSTPILNESRFELDDDYFIENAKKEIQVRIGQSKFRKGVLKNFDFKCALTGITEKELLRASHIVPWSDDKNFRGDVLNGILFCSEIDDFFDKGFISLTDDLEILLTPKYSQLSESLKIKLATIKGLKLSQPRLPIKTEYLEYYRKFVLKK